jgi:hypothetical protein
MKKILLSFLAVSLLFSCEIQRANGPKVSEKSLIDELGTLGMFGTVEPMRALSIILAGTSEEENDIGTFSHPSSNTWNFIGQWWEGGPDRMWLVTASSPIHFDKAADDSWTISYEGNGMEYSYYERMSFKTTAIPNKDGWHIVTMGAILDKDGYEMSFGTTGVTLSTKITEKEYWTDWDFSLSDGKLYMIITKDSEVIDSVSITCTGNWNSTRLDADYLHFSTARFWQTVPGK